MPTILTTPLGDERRAQENAAKRKSKAKTMLAGAGDTKVEGSISTRTRTRTETSGSSAKTTAPGTSTTTAGPSTANLGAGFRAEFGFDELKRLEGALKDPTLTRMDLLLKIGEVEGVLRQGQRFSDEVASQANTQTSVGEDIRKRLVAALRRLEDDDDEWDTPKGKGKARAKGRDLNPSDDEGGFDV